MASGVVNHGVGTSNKVMVFNVPQDFTNESLHSMFSHFGEILFAELRRDKITNQCLGYGKIEFAKQADAQKAIEEVNGLQLGKKKLKVSYPEPFSEELKTATRIQIVRLPIQYKEDNVEEMCKKFGKILKVRLVRDSITGKSRSVAFVFYERCCDANTAVRALDGYVPDGKHKLKATIMNNDYMQKTSNPRQPGPYSRQVRPISQQHHHQQHQRPRLQQLTSYVANERNCCRVFVYNVGELETEQELYNIFSQFGGLVKIDIARNPQTNNCKGFAFLAFDNRVSAENAIFTLDGMMHKGRILQVRFKQD